MPLEIVSHYRIIKKLGAGGMGEVYLAEDTRLGRKVALKLLPEEFTRDAERLRRFTLEARAASALNHPNIITIYDIGQADSSHFITTEYVEGDTLRHHMRRARMSVSEALAIAIQVTSALSAAHQAGIVHRDLKPENVMLRPDGITKLLDFGLAKLSQQQAPSADTSAPTVAQVNTGPNVILGTLAYMSPEQARGKEVDARTDVFSIGVLLYEIVTGRAPFEGETTSDIIAAILKSEPEPISRYLPEAPAELQRIISKSLRKDMEERYQTMKDLLVDLKSLRQELEFMAKLERSTSQDSGSKSVATSGGVAATTAPEQAATTEQTVGRTSSSAEYIVTGLKRHKLAAVVVLLVVVAGAVAGGLFSSTRNSQAVIESIAVLPFENASGNAELEYLSDGVSESVIDRLSQLPQLKVIARSSSFRYRGENLNLQEIANALGVQAIVTGRVVQRDDSYVIRVDLTDARENKQLWGEHFTRKASEVLTLQTDISREIAENLRLKLSGAQPQLTKQPANARAYELVLQGIFYRNKGDQGNREKAIERFQQAIDVDPNYALAYAGLADAYRFLDGDPKESLPKREAAIRRALELDENLAEAHFGMGQYQRDLWNWHEAEREYRRAMLLNPNYAHAHSGLSGLLSLLGRLDEAMAEDKLATQLDPVGVVVNTVAGRTLHFARRYDEAIEQLKKTIELDNSSPTARIRLADVYVTKGMYREAVREYEQAVRLGSVGSEVQARLGAACAKMGERERAMEILKRLQTGGGYISPVYIAILYAALGASEPAFASLERAYATRSPSLQFLKVDPAFNPLRSDPRFQDLLTRVGLPQ